MGTKGDRATKEPLAKDLYADRRSLVDISKQLDISDTTLRRWKAESKVPGEDLDGWDKARVQRRSISERVMALFLRELGSAESTAKGAVTSATGDSLTKLGSLAVRWAEVERSAAGRALDIDSPKIFLENLEWLAKSLRDLDPEGLKVLARNFDALIIQFKAEHAKTA